MDDFLNSYFIQNGIGFAILGAMLSVAFGVWGSSVGIRIASAQSLGLVSEKPEVFTPCLILTALPGTQGFYGFICGIYIALRVGLMSSVKEASQIPTYEGIGLLFIGLMVGFMEYKNAVNMGMACASSINLVGKHPEEFGRSILFPALIETYAVVALLMGILMITWVTA